MKKIMLLILIFSSIQVHAGWTGYGKITELNQQPNNGVSAQSDILIKATLPNNGSGCSDTNTYMLFVESKGDERSFSMLLSAFMAGKEVRLFYTGECHPWNAAIVKGVYIK